MTILDCSGSKEGGGDWFGGRTHLAGTEASVNFKNGIKSVERCRCFGYKKVSNDCMKESLDKRKACVYRIIVANRVYAYFRLTPDRMEPKTTSVVKLAEGSSSHDRHEPRCVLSQHGIVVTVT